MQTTLRRIYQLGSSLLTRNTRTLPGYMTQTASIISLYTKNKINSVNSFDGKKNGKSWQFVSKWDEKDKKISHWLEFNNKVYPPQDPSEPRRPAYVCHELKRVKYSQKKMWYAAHFVRGLSVDEALKQLACQKYKGARIAERAIKEAMDMAVKEHDVEYRSNLWVAESFACKSLMLKGIRRHAKGRITKIRYRYCNYYVRLEEGPAPPVRKPPSGDELLDKWFGQIRARKITNSL